MRAPAGIAVHLGTFDPVHALLLQECARPRLGQASQAGAFMPWRTGPQPRLVRGVEDKDLSFLAGWVERLGSMLCAVSYGSPVRLSRSGPSQPPASNTPCYWLPSPPHVTSHPSSSSWESCDHGPNKPLTLKSLFQVHFWGIQPRAHFRTTLVL